MARDPAARFQTAKEFQLALEHWANNAGPELAQALRAPAAGRGSIADGTGQFARQALAVGPQLGTGTPGTWANTGGVTAQLPAPIKHSNAGLFVVLGVVGLLVIGGGVLGMRVLSKAPEAAPAAAGAECRRRERPKPKRCWPPPKRSSKQRMPKPKPSATPKRRSKQRRKSAASAATAASAAPAPSVAAAASKQKVAQRRSRSSGRDCERSAKSGPRARSGAGLDGPQDPHLVVS